MKAGSLERPDQFVVVNDHTLRIDSIRKDKLTLPDLAVPVAIVINSELAKQHATADDPWAMEYLKANRAAGGTFKVESWRPGHRHVRGFRRSADDQRLAAALPVPDQSGTRPPAYGRGGHGQWRRDHTVV
jgi:hypothetical protein